MAKNVKAPEKVRVCCICKAEAARLKSNRPRLEGEPIMISITPMIYRRGQGKRMLKNAASVHVCESCLDLVIEVPFTTRETERLPMALLASIEDRYNSLKREDAA